MRQSDHGLEKVLITSKNYQDFLSKYFTYQKKHIYGFSISSFSAKAGFSSSSLISDLLSKRRSLTHSSLNKILNALILSEHLKRFFLLLVVESSPHFSNYVAPNESKEKIRYQVTMGRVTKNEAPLNLSLLQAYVYAAIGHREGSTIKELLKTTDMKEKKLQSILNEMEELQWITKEGERYLPSAFHFIMEDAFMDSFKRLASKYLELIAKEIKTNNPPEYALFNFSSILISEQDLPELKKKLTETIESFIAHAENAEGARVMDLFVYWDDFLRRNKNHLD